MQNNFPKIPLALSIIFFVLSCLTFFLVYRETNSNYQKSGRASVQWQSQARRRDEMKSLDHSIKIIEKERTELATHFAQSSDVVPFLDAIEALAPKTGVKVQVTSVDILIDSVGLLVGMNVTGNFEGLYKFLTLLENFPYELELTSMDLRKEEELDVSKKGAKISKWEATISVRLLSFIN